MDKLSKTFSDLAKELEQGLDSRMGMTADEYRNWQTSLCIALAVLTKKLDSYD